MLKIVKNETLTYSVYEKLVKELNEKYKEEIFEEQLRRCQIDYFDFYLCHNVCEKNIDSFLDPKFGLVPYLLEQKKAGKIRHLGFSTHGSLKVIRRFLEACGGDNGGVEHDVSYKSGSEVNLSRHDFGICGDKQYVIEGQSFAGKLKAVFTVKHNSLISGTHIIL